MKKSFADALDDLIAAYVEEGSSTAEIARDLKSRSAGVPAAEMDAQISALSGEIAKLANEHPVSDRRSYAEGAYSALQWARGGSSAFVPPSLMLEDRTVEQDAAELSKVHGA